MNDNVKDAYFISLQPTVLERNTTTTIVVILAHLAFIDNVFAENSAISKVIGHLTGISHPNGMGNADIIGNLEAVSAIRLTIFVSYFLVVLMPKHAVVVPMAEASIASVVGKMERSTEHANDDLETKMVDQSIARGLDIPAKRNDVALATVVEERRRNVVDQHYIVGKAIVANDERIV